MVVKADKNMHVRLNHGKTEEKMIVCRVKASRKLSWIKQT